MLGYPTSYFGMFDVDANQRPTVTSIEIPLIQRDYAQGRRGPKVDEIRSRFLEVLFEAVTGEQSVGLDFIYGDVTGGTLRPLDGQQRLTTLFLLHWYIAARSGHLNELSGWAQFSYATRASARLFCQRLVACSPPSELGVPSRWIIDQAWYLHVWVHDPTISSMLVMLDAIGRRFDVCDPEACWRRLTSTEDPAVTFELLPIDEMGQGEELYIKMNSRGKALTEFETFKALFERTIEFLDRSSEFEQKIDGQWSDLLWPRRGYSDNVDEEFLRYLRFIVDICHWRAGQVPRGALQPRALKIFGVDEPTASANLDFLFHAFDTWVGVDLDGEFDHFFVPVVTRSLGDQRLLLFSSGDTNLFTACCHLYSDVQGLGYARTLLLYSILLHRANPESDFPRRLRLTRNLIEASEDELRPQRLPAVIADVDRIVVDRSLSDLNGFNKAQIEDERAKWDFIAKNPSLQPVVEKLEDHRLLRGSLQAFELDADAFRRRAETFEALMSRRTMWSSLTGALLATGDYARSRNTRDLQFGSGTLEGPWRLLLTGTYRSSLETTRKTLGTLLDSVAASELDVAEELLQIQHRFLHERQIERCFDWRYYLVKYNVMRDGPSGIYASPDALMGYSICMLNKTQMNGHYRDPYLNAVIKESGSAACVEEGSEGGPWFRGGYVTDARWMKLRSSGAGLRCVANGFAIRQPIRDEHLEQFERVCDDHQISRQHGLVVPQTMRDGVAVDSADRVQLAGALLRDLAAEGL